MQLLEVCGAVRPIYGSLGVKRLIRIEFSRLVFEKYSNMKFHENPSSGGRVIPCGQKDRHGEPNSLFSQFSKQA